MANVTVAGNVMPWAFTGGINSSFPFGINDGIAPVIAASGLVQNQLVKITYVSGTITAGSGHPAVNANGDTGTIANGNNGSTGTNFPSLYMSSSWGVPVYLVALVGAWCDRLGNVIQPVYLGNGPTQLIVPSGASQLQIGVNDDKFVDNTGSWTIGVVAAESTFWHGPAFGIRNILAQQLLNNLANNTTGSGQVFPTGY